MKPPPKIVRLAILVALVAAIVYGTINMDWRLRAAFVLWIAFFTYWGIQARNRLPDERSERKSSTAVHQVMLNGALVLLFVPVPGLTGWFLPERWHWTVVVGAIIQAGFAALAVWARRHLGRNWAAEVRVGIGHELICSGPYRYLRHPIYTAMLGMALGTAIASSQYHALLGVAIIFVAYIRKTRLEEDILGQTFGEQYATYRRRSWRLVPPIF